MYAKIVALVLTTVFVGVVIADGQDPGTAAAAGQPDRAAEAETPDQEADGSFWMEKKLSLSQKVFAGLAEGDFEAISVAAEAMSVLNRIESFTRGRFPGYRNQLRAFTSANRDLIAQASRENLEGTTLAFTQLTFSCVQCHQKLRDGGGAPEAAGQE